eukprot:UN33281
MGWVNWVVFKCSSRKKLRLLNTDSFGSGSIYKLSQSLPEDQVLFALLRMSFGVTPYRRTHVVLLHWIGPEVKHVKRGKLNANAPNMHNLLKPFGICLQLGRKDEITVENIITRVRKLIVIDGGKDEPTEVINKN